MLRADPQAILATPEGIDVRVGLASAGSRAVAFVLDLLFIVPIAAVLVQPLMALGELGALPYLDHWRLGFAAMAFTGLTYFCLFEIFYHGATPGKRLRNLKVISQSGARLDAHGVLVRNLMRAVEFAVPAVVLGDHTGLSHWMLAATGVLVVGLLPLRHPLRLRVGDLVAGTMVARVPKLELSATEVCRESPPGSFEPACLTVYGEAELYTLAELLRRVPPSVDADHGVLDAVARAIHHKVGIAGPPPADSEAFLRSFYLAQRAFLERRRLLGRPRARKSVSGDSGT